jgi:hypothetical protein
MCPGDRSGDIGSKRGVPASNRVIGGHGRGGAIGASDMGRDPVKDAGAHAAHAL